MISNTEKQKLSENSNELRLEEREEKKDIGCVCVCCSGTSVYVGVNFAYKGGWMQEL